MEHIVGWLRKRLGSSRSTRAKDDKTAAVASSPPLAPPTVPDAVPALSPDQVERAFSDEATNVGSNTDEGDELPEGVHLLLELLGDWIDTPDWDASRTYLTAHADALLSNEAEAFLAMFAQAQQSDGARQAIADHQRLLRLCREHGIAGGYVHFLASLPGSDNMTDLGDDLDVPLAVRGLLAQTEELTQPWEQLARAELIEQALALVRREFDAALWAALQIERGDALVEASTGERAANIAQAIAALRAALTVYTREAAPANWAITQNNLGTVLDARAELEAGAERRATLEQAIAVYHEALTVRTREAAPAKWAITQHNLANALRNRAELEEGAERRATLEQAIVACHAALSVSTREAAPAYWALTQNNLGIALRDRARLEEGAERRASLEAAIEAYRAALSVDTREAAPASWAGTQNNLANALHDRAALEEGTQRRATLEAAIEACHAALSVRTHEAAPADWAATQNNLANALRARAELEEGAERRASLEAAIEAYRAGLSVRTHEAAPADWALIQNNLGIALHDRAALEEGTQRRATLEAAIAACQAALTVYTRQAAPASWAGTQNSLANALRARAAVEEGAERRASLEAAIEAYRAALSVATRQAAPVSWAITQHNLANALLNRAALEEEPQRRASLEAAIEAYRAAIIVRTRETAPADWAATQHNLAAALLDRAELEEGAERWATLEAAIAAYRAALIVRTREAAPADWAATQNNLANALRARAELEEGAEWRATLEQAIVAYHEALTVRTWQAAPADWAATQNNLAIALLDRAALEEEPQRRATLEQAIAAYHEALTVYTREDAPRRHRDLARTVGAHLFADGAWAQAADWYTRALDAQDDLFALSLTAADRADYLESGGEVAAPLAYALARMGTAEAALRAAAALERSRARATGEALARERAQVEAAKRLAPDLLQRFIAASEHLMGFTVRDAEVPATSTEDGGGSAQAVFTAAAMARNDYVAALAANRDLQPDFLRPGDPIADAVAQLRLDERLVYVATTERGAALILLVRGDENEPKASGQAPSSSTLHAEACWDEQMTSDRVVELLERRDEHGQVTGGLVPAQYGLGQLSTELQHAMVALGSSDGVLTELRRRCHAQAVRRLIVVPCGWFGLLPLHAALVPDGTDEGAGTVRHGQTAPLQDSVRVSYAPSARIWAASRRRATTTTTSHKQHAPVALVVGNPLPHPHAQPLAGAEAEAGSVRQLVFAVEDGRVVPAGPVLDREHAMRRVILDALHEYHASLTHAHFACHGLVEFDRPERSGLLFANGARLMVRDLRDDRRLRFAHLRLATLSACQTGLPGTTLPDEVVSLPSAWLQAGAAGVVGSLWPVSDSATVALMTKVYELHLLDGLEPADALWLAQRWLRGLRLWRQEFLSEGATHAAAGPEAREVVQALAQALVEARGEAAPLDDDEHAEDTEDGVRGGRGAGDQRRGETPRHWAAFAHYGS